MTMRWGTRGIIKKGRDYINIQMNWSVWRKIQRQIINSWNPQIYRINWMAAFVWNSALLQSGIFQLSNEHFHELQLALLRHQTASWDKQKLQLQSHHQTSKKVISHDWNCVWNEKLSKRFYASFDIAFIFSISALFSLMNFPLFHWQGWWESCSSLISNDVVWIGSPDQSQNLSKNSREQPVKVSGMENY